MIKVALAGVGNVASAFVQGLAWYRQTGRKTGLMQERIGPYGIDEVEVVAAFDIDQRKVGKKLSEAIFSKPNCTDIFFSEVESDVIVLRGPTLDGLPNHLALFVEESPLQSVDVGKALLDCKADVLVNLLPTGSKEASRHYAFQAIGVAGISFINGIPEPIAADPELQTLAKKQRVCLIGDDFKSQLGTTFIHRTLLRAVEDRGVDISKTHQFNYAGNTDFINLVHRGDSKKKSKTSAIGSHISDTAVVGFSNFYIAGQDDAKTGVIHIHGDNWGGNKLTIDVRLSVNDSANAAGVIGDVVRIAKVLVEGQQTDLSGDISSYYMKMPAVSVDDLKAKVLVKAAIDVSSS